MPYSVKTVVWSDGQSQCLKKTGQKDRLHEHKLYQKHIAKRSADNADECIALYDIADHHNRSGNYLREKSLYWGEMYPL